MIASIFRVPVETPAVPDLVEQVAGTPGLPHMHLLEPGDGDGERLTVLFQATEHDCDAYLESDASQPIPRDNPGATCIVFTVTQLG